MKKNYCLKKLMLLQNKFLFHFTKESKEKLDIFAKQEHFRSLQLSLSNEKRLKLFFVVNNVSKTVKAKLNEQIY